MIPGVTERNVDPAAPDAGPAAPASRYDDSRRPLASAARHGALALAAVTVVSLLIWGGKEGLPGVWAVLLGAAIGGGFVLLTVATVWATARTSPTVTGAVVLGGWLLKIIALIAVLALIRDAGFYDRIAFVVTVAVVLVATLAAEVWGMAQENLTYAGSR
ncbi:membrane protein [Corynebacterium sphenisci DSM 44792]|uniref:Membrane protein n=1 Tax=Corynebacterium sphenisci DSM 44792 TaxID=1437874 RepID=A0A1L7CX35_9CORY|nr:membrane protein [Corynebacterium sphenisci DSM 44792]